VFLRVLQGSLRTSGFSLTLNGPAECIRHEYRLAGDRQYVKLDAASENL
jgi:hypothetical protein